ncbi:hypothetical protein [Trueperella bialowiezensis]|uniref:Uncharacterized protein n=1 Tax=Trueperella bialowiezensis TaxID=312285 RepID=A0A3S5EW41_9ACTO|nr:hypothetical protein [Trueperella bialowiezensis]VEI13611.1 Uncharacterised protein [Trueperella bialowiezensis]
MSLLFDRVNPARPAAAYHPPLIWASVGAFFAAVLALGVSFGPFTSAVAALLLGLAVIPGWPVLMGVENRVVSRVVMLLTLAAALPAAYFGTIKTTAVVAAGAIIAAFIGEMFRRDGHVKLVEHMSASVAGAMMMVSASLWVHAGGAWNEDVYSRLDPGPTVGLTIAIVIAVAALIHGFDSPNAGWLGTLNAMVTGAVSAYLLGGPVWMGLFAGAAVGVVYAGVQRALTAFERPLTWVQGITKALVPHCSLGVIGYIFTMILL